MHLCEVKELGSPTGMPRGTLGRRPRGSEYWKYSEKKRRLKRDRESEWITIAGQCQTYSSCTVLWNRLESSHLCQDFTNNNWCYL